MIFMIKKLIDQITLLLERVTFLSKIGHTRNRRRSLAIGRDGKWIAQDKSIIEMPNLASGIDT